MSYWVFVLYHGVRKPTHVQHHPAVSRDITSVSNSDPLEKDLEHSQRNAVERSCVNGLQQGRSGEFFCAESHSYRSRPRPPRKRGLRMTLSLFDCRPSTRVAADTCVRACAHTRTRTQGERETKIRLCTKGGRGDVDTASHSAETGDSVGRVS